MRLFFMKDKSPSKKESIVTDHPVLQESYESKDDTSLALAIALAIHLYKANQGGLDCLLTIKPNPHSAWGAKHLVLRQLPTFLPKRIL